MDTGQAANGAVGGRHFLNVAVSTSVVDDNTTKGEPKWERSSSARTYHSTVLKGDVVNEVSKLKQRVNGDIVVYASGQLAHTLIEHDLVDELRLMIYPFVLGAGERLFGETGGKKPMRLVDTRTVGDGL